jgi:hypothetical protein
MNLEDLAKLYKSVIEWQKLSIFAHNLEHSDYR